MNFFLAERSVGFYYTFRTKTKVEIHKRLFL